MRTEEEFRPRVGLSNPRENPDQWLHVADALAVIERARAPKRSVPTIKRSAEQGYLHAWAATLVVGETRWSGGEIPAVFWAEWLGDADSWETGNFSIFVEKRFEVRAYGVMLNKLELARVYPWAFESDRGEHAPPPAPKIARARGGRKKSVSWPVWVAELAAYVHETGIPDGEGSAGVDVVIAAVSERLARRGFEGLSRSTVQETVRAVLRRMREPETKKS